MKKEIIVFILLFLICLIVMSCKLGKEVSKKKEIADTTAVKKSSVQESSVDTSKVKTESTNTKETTFYPQPIIIKDENNKPQIVFVPQSVKETQTDKSETLFAMFKQYVDNKFDSSSKSVQTETKDKKEEVKTDWKTWGIIIGIALLIFKEYIATIFLKIKTLKL